MRSHDAQYSDGKRAARKLGIPRGQDQRPEVLCKILLTSPLPLPPLRRPHPDPNGRPHSSDQSPPALEALRATARRSAAWPVARPSPLTTRSPRRASSTRGSTYMADLQENHPGEFEQLQRSRNTAWGVLPLHGPPLGRRVDHLVVHDHPRHHQWPWEARARGGRQDGEVLLRLGRRERVIM